MNLELKLKTLRAEVETLRLKGVDLTAADVERVPALQAEIADVEGKITARKSAEDALKAFGSQPAPGGQPTNGAPALSSRAQKASGLIQAFKAAASERGLSTKAMVPNSTIQVSYTGEVIADPRATFSLASLLTPANAETPSGAYMRQSVRRLNAKPVIAGEKKPQSGYELIHQTWELATLAHVLDAIKNQHLADIGDLADSIVEELAYGLDEAINDYILLGGFSEAGNFQPGLLNVPGIETQAFVASTEHPSISKLLTIRAALGSLDQAGVNATGIALSAADWQSIETAVDTTGRTILAADGKSAERRLWGVPVTVVNGMPEGEALVGDWGTVKLLRRGAYEILAFAQGTTEVPTGAVDGNGQPITKSVDMVSHNYVKMRAETRIGTQITSTPSFRRVQLTNAPQTLVISEAKAPSPEDSTRAATEEPALTVA